MNLIQMDILFCLNCLAVVQNIQLGKSDIRNPEEIDTDKINIGLSKKDYNLPTPEQQEKIEEFAKFVLKDNLKDKEDKNK